MTQVTDFEQLMAGVAAGKEEAMWELAETYTPYILRAVRASLPAPIRRRLDSQDFAQTLWASLLLNRTALSRLETSDQLIAFLARAARNKVIDATRHYLRAQRSNMNREQSLADIMSQSTAKPRDRRTNSLYSRDPSPSQYASLREHWNAILAATPDRDLKVLRLRMEGSSYEAIGQKLDMNPRTARRAIHRIIGQLAE